MASPTESTAPDSPVPWLAELIRSNETIPITRSIYPSILQDPTLLELRRRMPTGWNRCRRGDRMRMDGTHFGSRWSLAVILERGRDWGIGCSWSFVGFVSFWVFSRYVPMDGLGSLLKERINFWQVRKHPSLFLSLSLSLNFFLSFSFLWCLGFIGFGYD